MTQSQTDKIRKEFEDMDCATPIHHTLVTGGYQWEVEVNIDNPTWGLPTELNEYLIAVEGEIKGFSHVSEESITLYIKIER